NAVFNDGLMLLLTIIVAGDGARADVHPRADLSVAQVGQVVRFGATSEPRFLRLHEIAHLGAFCQLGAWAEPSEWTDNTRRRDIRLLQHRVRFDPALSADARSNQHTPLVDPYPRLYSGPGAQADLGPQFHVGGEHHIFVDKGARRIRHGDPGSQV